MSDTSFPIAHEILTSPSITEAAKHNAECEKLVSAAAGILLRYLIREDGGEKGAVDRTSGLLQVVDLPSGVVASGGGNDVTSDLGKLDSLGGGDGSGCNSHGLIPPVKGLDKSARASRKRSGRRLSIKAKRGRKGKA